MGGLVFRWAPLTPPQKRGRCLTWPCRTWVEPEGQLPAGPDGPLAGGASVSSPAPTAFCLASAGRGWRFRCPPDPSDTGGGGRGSCADKTWFSLMLSGGAGGSAQPWTPLTLSRQGNLRVTCFCRVGTEQLPAQPCSGPGRGIGASSEDDGDGDGDAGEDDGDGDVGEVGDGGESGPLTFSSSSALWPWGAQVQRGKVAPQVPDGRSSGTSPASGSGFLAVPCDDTEARIHGA